MQGSNFGGTFDQLFLRIFKKIFTEDASWPLLYHGANKSKMTKTQIKGGPALNKLQKESDRWQRFAGNGHVHKFEVLITGSQTL